MLDLSTLSGPHLVFLTKYGPEHCTLIHIFRGTDDWFFFKDDGMLNLGLILVMFQGW